MKPQGGSSKFDNEHYFLRFTALSYPFVGVKLPVKQNSNALST